MIQELIRISANYGKDLVNAFVLTLQLTFLSFLFGIGGGLALSILRTVAPEPIKIKLRLLVELIRGTPMTVQLFFIYYALPVLGFKLDPFVAALIALGINSAVYQSEYLRSAINSIPRNQWEAALSLGFSRLSLMLNIVIPQAIRIALPALTNELIYLLKFSSIAYFITLPELVYVAKWIGSKTFAYIEIYTVVALLYVVAAFIISEIMNSISKKLSIPGLTIEKT